MGRQRDQYPLNQWLIRRMNWRGGVVSSGSELPTPAQVRSWQLARLRETLRHARSNSPFFARQLKDVDVDGLLTMDDLARLPFMTPEDVRRESDAMVCVSQDEIARVVTLQSSGTTGTPKRVHHTAEDMEATCDYFRWGMSAMVGQGQTALVLLPGDRPGGVGSLLSRALERAGARAVCHGELTDARKAVEHILSEGAQCLVGSSAHLNLLARQWQAMKLPKNIVRSVLLCWDVAPEAVVRNVSRAFGCQVFRHWGMIETGLGGAVECAAGSGMHLREPDVLLEILDQDTLAPVPDGEFGEMVLTTPLRRGMPFIRYRTGDLGRIVPGPCGCCSPLRRLDPLVRRMDEGVLLGGHSLCLGDLNEALYALEDVWDFSVRLQGATLCVTVCGEGAGLERNVHAALMEVSAVRGAFQAGLLAVSVDTRPGCSPAVPGLGKRRLERV